MGCDACKRTRSIALGRLFNERRATVATVRGLGVLHSVLLIGMLVFARARRGVARLARRGAYPDETYRADLPHWVAGRQTGFDQADAVFDDTGLLPIATDNLGSPNPIHRLSARAILRVLRLPTLRNNVGALTTSYSRVR